MQLSYRGKTHPMLRGEIMRGCRKKVRRGVKHALAMGTLPLRVIVQAPRHASPEHRRARILRNIAIELTRGQFPRVASAAAGDSADASGHGGAGTNTTSVSGLPSSSDPLAPTDHSV